MFLFHRFPFCFCSFSKLFLTSPNSVHSSTSITLHPFSFYFFFLHLPLCASWFILILPRLANLSFLLSFSFPFLPYYPPAPDAPTLPASSRPFPVNPHLWVTVPRRGYSRMFSPPTQHVSLDSQPSASTGTRTHPGHSSPSLSTPLLLNGTRCMSHHHHHHRGS